MKISYAQFINFWGHLGLCFLPIQLGTFYWSHHFFGLRLAEFATPVYFLELFFYLGFIIAVFLGYKPKVDKQTLFLFLIFFMTKYLISPNSFLTIYLSLKIFILWQWWQMLAFVKLEKKLIPILTFQLFLVFILVCLQIQDGHSIQGFWYFLGERAFNLNTPGIATFTINGREFLRGYATFAHPNILAGYAGLVFVWIYLSKNVNKLLKVVDLLLSFLLVVLSWSQAAWLGLVLFILFEKLIKFLFKKNSKNLFVFKIGGLAFLITVPIFLLFLGNIHNESLILRNQIFIASLQIFYKNLLFGVPWPGAQLLFSQIPSYLIQPKNIQPVHNVFWWLVEFLGIWGVILISKPLFWMWKQYIKLNSYQFLAIIFILITASFDHYWITGLQTTWILLFFLRKI